MIGSFEQSFRSAPEHAFFRFVEDPARADGIDARTYSYERIRRDVAALVHRFSRLGLKQGSFLALDLDNCPAFVITLLTCAYTGVNLVVLNHRLTDDEKRERVAEIVAENGVLSIPTFTEDEVLDQIARAHKETTEGKLLDELLSLQWERPDAPRDFGVVMFTSGTTGRPKAVLQTGERLCASARACNRAFSDGDDVMWQVALPLFHIGGMQMVIRSVLNGTPFLLYRRFDAKRVLDDAVTFHATHISVVDKMLQGLLDAAAPPVPLPGDTEPKPPLTCYRGILLGGAAANEATLQRARAVDAPVMASYGMTETASLVALCSIDVGVPDGAGGRLYPLTALPGYSFCIVAPDESGLGQLGLKGPGVIDDYLVGHVECTADGFFLTGDRARCTQEGFAVAERVGDMFVSGGENIYPEEIRKKALLVPGVTEAQVFGMEDPVWGRRPVAFVEMSGTAIDRTNAVSSARRVRTSLIQRLARIYRPDSIYVLDEFPRTATGKTDIMKLKALAHSAIDIRSVRIHRIRRPFLTPVRTAKTVLTHRESLIVEIEDAHGRTGIGECVSFSTDWYLPETISDDLRFLQEKLVPCVKREAFLRPDHVYPVLAELDGADRHLMAISAIETACWDLYGKANGASIAQMIDAHSCWNGKGMPFTFPEGMAPGGAVVGIASVEETLAAASRAVEAGYLRLKMKIAPGEDIDRIRAVREAFPKLMLVLDANQSYTEKDLDLLHAIDLMGCVCIEEPLDPAFTPKVGPRDLFDRLARLQRGMATPICLDESVITPADAYRALENPDLRGFVLKIGKFGGVLPALEFYWAARAAGATVWMGGMFDTGISKRLMAAFALLPGMTIPGDINEGSSTFGSDITQPPLTMVNGCVQVNPPGYEAGLGCVLDRAKVEELRFSPEPEQRHR